MDQWAQGNAGSGVVDNTCFADNVAGKTADYFYHGRWTLF
jgi:hypothetical protein